MLDFIDALWYNVYSTSKGVRIMATIREPARNIPIINDVDIVVLGGSCTGVFAAVRAARLGAKVAIVEQAGAFGGTATNSFVCIWHALTDTT